MEKLYDVLPGYDWVAGRRVPATRQMLLTDAEAAFDRALGRIRLADGQPVPMPENPLKDADVIMTRREGYIRETTVAQIAAYIAASGYPSLALSTVTFRTGAAIDDVLATISAPVGWRVTAETTFGGRVAVSSDGTKLLAARVETLAVAGSARIRATSPDGLRTIIETFALAYEAGPDILPPTVLTPATAIVAENAALVVQLLASEPVVWIKTGGADAAFFTLDTSATPNTLTLGPRDFEDPKDAGADNTYRVQMTATDVAGNATLFDFAATVTNVLEGAMAPIYPTAGPVDARDAADTVILPLAPLAEGESRTYVAVKGPAFPMNAAGQLIRGIAPLFVGTAVGKIRQTRGGAVTETEVRIWMGAAEAMGLGTIGTYTVTHQVDTVAQWNALAPMPGDVIALKRGAVFQGPLVLPATANGTADLPITITAYGTGAAPLVQGSAVAYADALTINGSHVRIDGLAQRGTHRSGIQIGAYGAALRPHHIEVRNCEIAGVGQAVGGNGDFIDVLHCEIRDLRMVVNTDGGGSSVKVAGEPSAAAWDDDYGANGMVISGHDIRFGYNRMLDGRAASYDYGFDGGLAEIFANGAGVYNVCIDNNYAERGVGLLEGGGAFGTNAVIDNVRVFGNVGVNLKQGVVLHNDALPGTYNGSFSAIWRNTRIYNNTLVEEQLTRSSAMSYVMLDSGDASKTAGIRFDHNIVALNDGDSVFKWEGGYHDTNCFFLGRKDPANSGSGQAGYTHLLNNWQMGLGLGEIYADPLFANAARRDFRLGSGSPAAGMGSLAAALAVPTTLAPPTGFKFATSLNRALRVGGKLALVKAA